MKKIFLTLGFVLASLGISVSEASAETYKLDTENSVIRWSNPLSNWTSKFSSASFEVTLQSIHGVLESNINSITSVPSGKEIETQLKSTEAFDTANHPLVKLEITASSTQNAIRYEAKAKFTIKGVSKEVKLDLPVFESKDGVLTIHGPMVLKAKDFNIKDFGSADIMVDLTIIAKK